MLKTKENESALSFGEIIKCYRMRCKMTKEFMAESLGVSCRIVSKWERGRSEPSIYGIIALAKLFDVSIDDLLRVTGCEIPERQNHPKNIKRILLIVVTAVAIIIALIFGVILVHNSIYYSGLINATDEKLNSFVQENSDVEFVELPANVDLDNTDGYLRNSDVLTFNLVSYYQENKKFESVFADVLGRFRIIGLELKSTQEAASLFSDLTTVFTIEKSKTPWLRADSKYIEHYWGNSYVYIWYEKEELVVILAESQESGNIMKDRLVKYLNN